MESIKEQTEMKLSPLSKRYLYSISGWSMFFAVLGFVGIGIMLLFGLGFSLMGSVLNEISSGKLPFFPWIGLVYFVLAACYIMPVIYLYKFSAKLKIALRQRSDNDLELSFCFLKKHFSIVGYITIVLLSLYLLIFIALIIAATMGVMNSALNV